MYELMTAIEARRRSKIGGDTNNHMYDVAKAIETATAEGHRCKQMFGIPWDTPNSDAFDRCRDKLIKAGYTVEVMPSSTMVSW